MPQLSYPNGAGNLNWATPFGEREALMGPDDVVSKVTIVRWSLDIISNSYAVAWWQFSKSGKFSFAPRHRDAIDAALRNLKDIRQSKRQY